MADKNISLAITILLSSGLAAARDSIISGQVSDLQNRAVVGAMVRLASEAIVPREVKTDDQGRYTLSGLDPGHYTVSAESVDFKTVRQEADIANGQFAQINLQFVEVASQHESIVITAKTIEPGID